MKAIRLLVMGLFVMGAILLIGSANPQRAFAQKADISYLDYPYIFPDSTPVNRTFHELWPTFCNSWIPDLWRDNGDGKLSPSDYLRFNTFWYHVDARTRTIFVGLKILPLTPCILTITQRTLLVKARERKGLRILT